MSDGAGLAAWAPEDGCGCGLAVARWTGRESRALREALRMSVRVFAKHLGVSKAAVSGWESPNLGQLRLATQELLDRALTLADADAKTRFALLLRHLPDVALPAAAVDPAPGPDVLASTSESAAPLTGLVSWDEVTVARRELGGLLAGWRQRAGLTQLALGERVRWARSTVANVERGQEARRPFWECCDEAVAAQGALLAAADRVNGLADQCRAQETDEGMRQRSAALATRTGIATVTPFYRRERMRTAS